MITNQIKEIYKGHFQVILDFPTTNDLLKIVDPSYNYIWGVNHVENRTEWANYKGELFGQVISTNNLQTRNTIMEFLISTKDFIPIIPSIHQTVYIVQSNLIPPYYLNLNKLQGKTKYELLTKIDYLFELDMPGSPDYTAIISPNSNFLEGVISKL